MRTFIRESNKALYFYGLHKESKDDKDYKNYILNQDSLCIPILDNSMNTVGFHPFIDDDMLLGESVDRFESYKNDKDFKEFENKVVEDENMVLKFNEKKAVEWLKKDLSKTLESKTETTEYKEVEEKKEKKKIYILKDIYGENE